MKIAAVLLSLVAAIGAEAPYNLPRPAPQAPVFKYPSAPAPQPLARPAPQPQTNFGYHYTPHIAAPQMYYEQPAPRPQYIPQPQPQYQPRPQPQPQLGYNYPAPQPQPVILPQPQIQIPPSSSYGLPQLPVQQLRQTYSQPAPRPAPQPAPTFQYQQQQYSQPGYAYQQPQPRFPVSLPVQSPALNNNAASLSSYQADSKQYSSQSHGDVLDSTVIDQITNIIKDTEHSSARSAGYFSLVSGVSLENAQPSIELSSFVQNLPAVSSISSSSQTSGASFLGTLTPGRDYGLPTITANSQPQLSSSSSTQNLYPKPQPATSYGAPY